MKNYVKHLKIISLIFILFSALNVFASSSLGKIAYHVPDSSKLYDYNDFYYSNFNFNSNGDYREAFSIGSMSARTYDRGNYIGNSSTGNSNFQHRNINEPFTLSKRFYYDESYQVYKLRLNFNETGLYNHIKLDNTYQIGIKFIKSKSLSFKNIIFKDSMKSIHIQDLEHDVTTKEASDFISVFDVNWYILPDENDSSKNSNTAFLIINFKFNSDDWIQDFTDFSLSQIELDLSLDSPLSYSSDSDYFFQNNTSNDLDYKVSYVSFIENGSISVSGTSIGSSSGGHSSGSGRHENLDVVYEDDLVKFDSLDICEDLDVVCHLKNLISLIKNLFVRIGNGISEIIDSLINGLKDLFIPSSEFMENFTTSNYQLLHTKLGFLLYPFEFLGSFLNYYLNLQRNSVISFNGFTLPNFDVQLIPAFTFDFDSILYSDNFSTLYNYYFIFIDSFIIICFINLCYKKFKEFMGE